MDKNALYAVEQDFELFRAKTFRGVNKDSTPQQIARAIAASSESVRTVEGLGHLALASSLFIAAFVRAIAEDGNTYENLQKCIDDAKKEFIGMFENVASGYIIKVNPAGPMGSKPN